MGRREGVEARRDGRRRVAAEDRREHRPEPTEREDRDRRLGQHRQEDADPRPLPDARCGQAPGGRTARSVELGPGERPDLAVLALPGERRVVGSRGRPRLGRRDGVVERAAGPPARPRPARRSGRGHARPALPGEPEVVDGRDPRTSRGRRRPGPGGLPVRRRRCRRRSSLGRTGPAASRPGRPPRAATAPRCPGLANAGSLTWPSLPARSDRRRAPVVDAPIAVPWPLPRPGSEEDPCLSRSKPSV